MTLMRKDKVIAHAKRVQNLFTLDLAAPGQAMSVRSRAMTITGRGRPTHLVSQNKRICIWHRRLGHISNARVVRASKLTDGIALGLQDKEYDPAKVLIDSDDSDDSESSDIETTGAPNPAPTPALALANQVNDVLDKLCGPCVGSKSTRVVRRDKSITPTTSKLEEVHADLWDRTICHLNQEARMPQS